MNRARRSTSCFKVDVGNGSAAENLSGSCKTVFTILSTVRRVKVVNDAAEHGKLNVGGGASAMFQRTLATFSVKNRLKDSVLIAEFAGMRPQPSRT